jgi:hypothetical protein
VLFGGKSHALVVPARDALHAAEWPDRFPRGVRGYHTSVLRSVYRMGDNPYERVGATLVVAGGVVLALVALIVVVIS